MPNLVPLNAGRGDALTRDLMRGTALAALPPVAGNRPRTYFIFQAAAGRGDADALIDCMLVGFRDEAFLVQVGGIAGAPYKSHPEALKERLDVRDAELSAKLIDLRINESGRHMIIYCDQNMAPELIEMCEILASEPFKVPFDIIYVAERTEAHIPFVDRCRKQALPLIVAEASSVLNRFSQGERLIIPALPSAFEQERQENQGKGQLSARLDDKAPPGSSAIYLNSLATFCRRLSEMQHV